MKLMLFLVALLALPAQAGPNSIVVTQRNAADTGNVFRVLDNPETNAFIVFSKRMSVPAYVTLGDGLAIVGGKLVATAVAGSVGPQGPKGDPGATVIGPAGATGPAGTAGKDGVNGSAGSDGKSAYQLAQASGYNGTLQAWLASLVGAAGRDGTNGTNGATGATGSKGDKGDPGQSIVGPQGPAGTPAPTFNFGPPVARTLAVSTAYQAANPAKPAIITVSPQCTAALTLTGGSTCSLQARIGTAPLTCASGTVVATWTNGNTGALSIGLALNQTVGAPYGINLPTGASLIFCATAGTFTITAAEQTAG